MGKNVWMVPQASGRFPNFAFGGKRDVSGERSVVEHDRYRARRETTGAGHIADGHGLLAVATFQSRSFSTSVPTSLAYRISLARALAKPVAGEKFAKRSLSNGIVSLKRFAIILSTR